MRKAPFFTLVILSLSHLQAQSKPAAPKTEPAAKPGVSKPADSVKPPAPIPPADSTAEPVHTSTPGFDLRNMDTSTDACVDFFQYACGAWIKNNPIPADRSSWSRISELDERNKQILRDILEKRSTTKIGNYYASCMDERAIDAQGTAPLKPELDSIAAIRDKATLASELARLHRIGAAVLFGFSSGQDFKNSEAVIAQADQGGLGLPDRDYYLKDDPKSVETRRQYLTHVRKMFQLLGDPEVQAAARAKSVMAIETALAKASLDLVSRREPAKLYHRMSTQELAALTPGFAWPRYLTGTGAPPISSLNVAVPDFFKQLDKLLARTSLEDLKAYLTWHTVHVAAPLLPAAFVNENFAFYGKILTGAKELRPRWKRCVDYTDNDLGEELGKAYVERTFGAEGKQRTLKMVRALEDALAQDIRQLDWMTPATKQKALEKMHAISNKIGYPEKWRDYSALRIARGDALGNSKRANEFEFHRQLNKIGKPVDRREWQMTPPTVNAYYDPQMNNINFPAGILQPPFYDRKLDEPVNFGGIGAVIGHELTHGFDDEGRQFDAQGNLRDWWTEQDAKEFEKRAGCIAEEYSGFTAVDDVKLNGKLTLGENTADNGGLRIAHMALMNVLAGRLVEKVGGFTPEQRLFLGYGQIWCENHTDEAARLRALTNPHSLAKFRVNGVVSNMPEFQKAFGCRVGQPMVREKACRVW